MYNYKTFVELKMKNNLINIFFVLIVGLAIGCSKSIETNGEVFVATNGGTNIKLGLVKVYFFTDEQYKIASDTNTHVYKDVIDWLNKRDSIQLVNSYLLHASFLDSLINYEKSEIYYLKESIKLEKGEYGNKDMLISDLTRLKKRQERLEGLISQYSETIANLSDNNRYSKFRFTTDKRALEMTFTTYIGLDSTDEYMKMHKGEQLFSNKEPVIFEKSNSDGTFKIQLKKNMVYWVFANANRNIGDNVEEYHWLFKYTPDGKSLFLSNDNMEK